MPNGTLTEAFQQNIPGSLYGSPELTSTFSGVGSSPAPQQASPVSGLAKTAGTVGTFLANPILGGTLGILGLIGKGIGAVQRRRRERELEEKNDRRYKEAMEWQAKSFEAQSKQWAKQYKLNRTQVVENLKQQQFQNEERNEERNTTRAQSISNRIFEMLNADEGRKSNFLNTWSR